jgi:outer membrane receptor protein involved in Fe transport
MFNIQVGGRESYNRQKYSEDFYGPFIGPEPSILSTRSSDRSFTYLVTPQLRLSDALMTYVRIASGYQAGGPNSPSTPTSPVPLTFAPSTTVNYEVGLKTFLFDQRLSIDANVFYINWTSIQLEGISPQGASFVFNGGKAKSQGVEIASEFRPLKGLTLSGSVSYTDAILTSDAGNGFPGVAGDPLPFSSKYSGSLSADDRFRITATLEGFVGATAAYVGARYETFPRDFGEPEPRVPAYAYLNLRSGFAIEGYTVTAFLKNATNERGVLSTLQQSGGTATSGVWYTAFIQPRTVGLSISKEF